MIFHEWCQRFPAVIRQKSSLQVFRSRVTGIAPGNPRSIFELTTECMWLVNFFPRILKITHTHTFLQSYPHIIRKSNNLTVIVSPLHVQKKWQHTCNILIAISPNKNDRSLPCVVILSLLFPFISYHLPKYSHKNQDPQSPLEVHIA